MGGHPSPRVCVSLPPAEEISHNPGPAGLARWPKAWCTTVLLLNTLSYNQFALCTSTRDVEKSKIWKFRKIREIRRKSEDLKKSKKSEVWAVLVVSAAWMCANNCLNKPCLPAGGVSDHFPTLRDRSMSDGRIWGSGPGHRPERKTAQSEQCWWC